MGSRPESAYHRHVSFGHALLKLRLSLLRNKAGKTLFILSLSRQSGPHHLPLLLQDDGLPGPLPQAQGLVMGGGHEVVSTGADGQTPDLPMVTLCRR